MTTMQRLKQGASRPAYSRAAARGKPGLRHYAAGPPQGGGLAYARSLALPTRPRVGNGGMTPSRERVLLAAAVLAALLPFAGTAFAIDAPVFLAVARQILAAPFDPFGFQMAWDATALDVARFNLNP